ncbi:hypothetical protein [Polaromonas sp.]|uniref:hypothetical protein n=1 Tax=Polaromonas sp. TaxID=1869339 RepID=UPI00184AAA62|nr:hypothetical protein [Polaromonas sp.]NML85713.1 hypothetical protein [Polaromonas sp.]
MTNTKPGSLVRTYAQNSCCGAALRELQYLPRYQSHSARKSLIYKDSLNCFFSGHFKESLDLQGLATLADKLSTKLSTENMENFKAVLNQGLSVQSGCVFEEVPITGYPK